MSATPLPYGPQSARIRAFLVQFAGLGAADRARVVEAHRTQLTSREWVSAERVLADTMGRSGRDAYREALSGPLLHRVRRPGAEVPTSEEAALDTLDPVAEPALAALLALLVYELLPVEMVRTLCAPFSGVLSPSGWLGESLS
jgi:hypothetical protein